MGLNFNELKELLEYIKEKHSWENMYEIHSNHPKRKIIKYVRFSMDTRENDIWNIAFDGIQNNNGINEVIFRTEMNYNLKDKIYEWLKEEKQI